MNFFYDLMWIYFDRHYLKVLFNLEIYWKCVEKFSNCCLFHRVRSTTWDKMYSIFRQVYAINYIFV